MSEDTDFIIGIQGFASEIHCAIGRKSNVPRGNKTLSENGCGQPGATVSWHRHGVKIFEGSVPVDVDDGKMNDMHVSNRISFDHSQGTALVCQQSMRKTSQTVSACARTTRPVLVIGRSPVWRTHAAFVVSYLQRKDSS